MKKIIPITIVFFSVFMINSEYLFTYKFDLNNTVLNSSCMLPENIGEVSTNYCGAENIEVFYAGDIENRYIYFSLNNEGISNWSNLTFRDNLVGSSSLTNGFENTELIKSAGIDNFPAASKCVNKGEGWYLPAIHELNLLYHNSSSLNYTALNIKNSTHDWYFSSTESSSIGAKDMNIYYGNLDNHNSSKYQSSPLTDIKCARTYNK